MTVLTGEDRNVYRRWRWQTFTITWLAYAGFYLTRKSFSVAKIGISHDPSLHMSDATMAWIDGAYLTAYALGQFLFGIAGDRLGTRLVVSAGMLLSVVAAIGMGASKIVVLFGVLFLIQGLCQSSGWAPLTKNMGAFFARKERGVVMGFWCTNYALGGLIASLVAGWAGDHFGWRWAFYVPAIVLLGVWILFLIFQANRPEDVGLPPIDAEEISTQTSSESDGSWRVIGEVILNPMVILLSLVYLMVKPARYAILFWGPKYINSKVGSGMAESGWLSGLFELAGPVGALAGGFLSDKVFGTRRAPVCVISLLLLGIALFCFNLAPANRLFMGAGFFVIGFLLFAADTLIAGAAAMDFGTKKGASTASGVINGMGSIGGLVGGTLPGFFNQRWGWGGVFGLLGAMAALGGLMLLPKWNALPKEAKQDRGFEVITKQPAEVQT